jgi:hypothetical protein
MDVTLFEIHSYFSSSQTPFQGESKIEDDFLTPLHVPIPMPEQVQQQLTNEPPIEPIDKPFALPVKELRVYSEHQKNKTIYDVTCQTSDPDLGNTTSTSNTGSSSPLNRGNFSFTCLIVIVGGRPHGWNFPLRSHDIFHLNSRLSLVVNFPFFIVWTEDHRSLSCAHASPVEYHECPVAHQLKASLAAPHVPFVGPLLLVVFLVSPSVLLVGFVVENLDSPNSCS